MAAQNVADLSSLYLKSINAPDTPGNRQVVASWMALESGFVQGTNRQQINVVGNNPLNITGTGDCGSRTWVGHQFAIYCTPQSGAGSTADLLTKNPQYGYTDIVSALQGNNQTAALQAISASKWTPTHYGPSGRDLVGVYSNFTGTRLDTTTTAITNDVTAASGMLGGFGDAFQLPVGTIVTEAHIQDMLAVLDKQGKFDPNPVIRAFQANAVQDQLRKDYLGKPWVKASQTAGSAADFAAANKAADPLGVGGLITTLGSPQTWLRVLAVGGGLLLILIGSKTMVDDMRGHPAIPV